MRGKERRKGRTTERWRSLAWDYYCIRQIYTEIREQAAQSPPEQADGEGAGFERHLRSLSLSVRA